MEQCNLSNWYPEFFPVWLKQQILCWDSIIMVVFAITILGNHAKAL